MKRIKYGKKQENVKNRRQKIVRKFKIKGKIISKAWTYTIKFGKYIEVQ